MKILVTGITGQDGYYLAQQFLKERHEVYGMVRGRPGPARDKILEELPGIQLVEGDLLDQTSLLSVLKEAQPEVVYNMAAITFVGLSWAQPALMSEVTGLGVLRMLEAIRLVNPEIRMVQASSSEMYGQSRESPQDELTPLNPRSPYGVAKTFAHYTVINYRESYGIHASTAIMFNHESPRRGVEFISRKVALGAARIKRDGKGVLALGNLDAQRDWGWAPEYMEALPLIAAQPEPGDFCIATGETHSVRELCDVAFSSVGLDWQEYVVSDKAFLRPADINTMRGDARKAKRMLGFEPQIRFKEVTKRLVEAELGK